jgi:hypothetical protein
MSIENENRTIKVTFTDTFGGELNYCWTKVYEFENVTAKRALTLAKQDYFLRLPRHHILWGSLDNLSDDAAVKFDGYCIAATIETGEL